MLGVSSSSCYSDTTYGGTTNAAIAGLSWGMGTILPDTSGPYISVQIHGLTHRYKMVKEPNSDAKVYVRNEDAVNGGNVFEEVDDGSKVRGGTL